MKIAVIRETEEGELRVAATPETVKKYIALGASVAVETGAGEGATIADADYLAAGASVGPRRDVLADADAVLAASIFHFGTYTIGEAKAQLAAAGITVRPA